MDFEVIRIKIASPEKIRDWSYGEVKKPETINYRTFKPERDGLFCAKIFGPIKDWECICGKYKRIEHRGIVCDKCGVEVIQSKVRRERLGHVELVAPVSHIWYLKSRPSIIGTLLDLTKRDLEKVLYFESFIVTDPGDTQLKVKELLGEDEYKQKISEYGTRFKVGMGAEAIRMFLNGLNLNALSSSLKQDLRKAGSEASRAKLAQKLRLVEDFRKSTNRPEWMIMDVIPVLPPDLRPLVPLEGGRFATSDLNDLYRRVINRNNRLRRLMELKAPSVIIKNEKRMLQEAVDALFDNGHRSKVLKTATKRPLKSLSDMIKGKQGRFRQNLVGKTVDYSGRSVIVPDPTLRLHQCGLPKIMALELFKPFLFTKLEEWGLVTSIKDAKELVERKSSEVWNALEEVIRELPILLNRVPTLHRLGMQAFDPVLIEGKAIKLHPLVSPAFNADFDGDQMSVHVPLSVEAQVEARVLMSSINNVLSPANGQPIIEPTQDTVFGIHYLTKEERNTSGKVMIFSDIKDVILAYEAGVMSEHAMIKVRIAEELHKTTVGRALFYDILPCGIPFPMVNKTICKNDIRSLIIYLHREFGPRDTVDVLNKLTSLGFEYATKSGISVCLDDFKAPLQQKSLIEEALLKEKAILQECAVPAEDSENCDLATVFRKDLEKAIADSWRQTSLKIINATAEEYTKTEGTFNSLSMMVLSGASGSWENLCHISGVIGSIEGFRDHVLPLVVASNYKTGLSYYQYILTTSAARNRLIATSLTAADAGYLLRRLIEAVHDIVISENDCGISDGIPLETNLDDVLLVRALSSRIVGRIAVDEVRDPLSGEILARPHEEITEAVADRIEEAGITRLFVRSPVICKAPYGICAKCYGRDLSTGQVAQVGDPVGINAAHSIGEPTEQLVINNRLGRCSNKIIKALPIIADLFEARKTKDKISETLHKILSNNGIREAQLWLLNTLQSIYTKCNIDINDKHFEVFIRRMSEKIKILDPGDTTFLKGKHIDRKLFFSENAEVQFDGGRPATGTPLILGITKASLTSDSFISAASFQDTTRVLTEAAICGAVDELKGLKENVIIGRLILAGTGMGKYRDTFVKRDSALADCIRRKAEEL